MLLSMTGFGRAINTIAEKTISVEIRSLNSKFSDLRLKIPQNYREIEPNIRKIINDRTSRGKIELNIDVQSVQGDEACNLNNDLFRKYYKELSGLATELSFEAGDMMQAILRLPNVVVPANGTLEEDEKNMVQGLLNEAIDNFLNFRKTEGLALEEDILERVRNISQLLTEIPVFEKERVERLRVRMTQSLEEYFAKDNIDNNRFEQELIYYLEKMDITEEKVRLEQHCKYFIEQLGNKKELKGRKLSFISQEIGREINTLGAKANSSDIQRIVVGMKDELEKIKEQLANSV